MIDELSRYKRVIIWGVREGTHVHIHRHFFDTFTRLGIETMWLDNAYESCGWLEPGTLVIAAWDSSELIYRDQVDYCLHNYYFPGMRREENIIYLQVFMDLKGRRWEQMGPDYETFVFYDRASPEASDYEWWGPVTLWNPELRVLCQPWGTPVFAEDFGDPVFNLNRDVAFVGSVWDNAEHMGSRRALTKVQLWADRRDLNFEIHTGVTDEEARDVVRGARLAPAIGGEYQVDTELLPCRGFKNISYGALGFTNLLGYRRLLADCSVVHESIPELMDGVLAMKRGAVLELIRAQQEIVKHHTYVERIQAICQALTRD